MNDLLIDDKDLIQRDNTSTRIPVVMCLDTSQSMTNNNNAGFDGLNNGVKAFFDACKNDTVNKYGFDLAIVTFGAQGVNISQEFQPIWNCDYPEDFAFSAENWIDGTPLGEGVNKALELLENRKQEYKDSKIGYYQPWLVLITDGVPTTSDYLEETIDQCRKLQKSRKLKVIAVGVNGDEEPDNDDDEMVGVKAFEIMAQYVIDGKVLVTKDFSYFDKVFEFMSKSISGSSDKNSIDAKVKESPLGQIVEDLQDEGIITMGIEEFPVEEDLAALIKI